MENILFATPEQNFEKFEKLVKNSWADFFASMNSSFVSIMSWLEGKSNGFDRLIAVIPRDFLEENIKKILVIERIAKRFEIPVVFIPEEEIVNENDLYLRIKNSI